MRKEFKILIVSAMAVACSREMPGPEDTDCCSGVRQIPVEIHTLPFEGDGPEAKSAYGEYQDKITGINVLVYNEETGLLVEDCSAYFSLDALRKLTLPATGRHNVYFLANVPDLSENYPQRESGLENFGQLMESYDEFAVYGFPMSYSQQIDSDSGGIVNVWFRRLVTRLELSFDKSALSKLHREGTYIKSLKLCNAALDVYPFAKNGSAAKASTGATALSDKAVEADVNVLNEGGRIFLYTLTNMQGVLLPADTPQSEKTPEKLEGIVGKEKLALLTYIEARCRLDCDDWSGEDVVLRHYLGGTGKSDYNCSFDIHPGRSRYLKLVLTEDDPLLQPWRFEPEGAVEYKKFSLSSKEVNIMKNFPADLTVTAPFDFNIVSCGPHFKAAVTESSFNATDETWNKTIRITTDELVSGLLPPGQKASSFDGKLVLGSATKSGRDTSVTVKTYHEVFPVTFCVDKNGLLKIFGDNPLNLTFRCEGDITEPDGNIIKSFKYAICSPFLPDSSTSMRNDNVIGEFDNAGKSAVVLSIFIRPFWKGSSGFNMGKGNGAMFGPGDRYSPGRLDATKVIMYSPPGSMYAYTIDFNSNAVYDVDLSYTSDNSPQAPQVFFLPSTAATDPALWTTDGFSFGKPDYRFTLGDYTPPRSTGHNNCDNYSLADFEDCPFYIANGTMQATSLHLYTHSWNATNQMEDVRVNFLRPGRDLFDGSAGEGGGVDAKLGFRIKGVLYHLFDVNTYVEEASYAYSGVHLIVNGCTCWPGGSIAP